MVLFPITLTKPRLQAYIIASTENLYLRFETLQVANAVFKDFHTAHIFRNQEKFRTVDYRITVFFYGHVKISRRNFLIVV